jgi:hypothetical protein
MGFLKTWFFDWLERNGRHRIIMDRTGKVPYMHRYNILFKDKINEFDDGPKLPFNIMLHHIVLSDQDGFHDHPWWYFTLILKGGYWEETPNGIFWRGPGHFRISRPESLHKLTLPADRKQNPPGWNAKKNPIPTSAWTLFIKGPKVRSWGFIRPDGRWEYWRTYLQKRYGIRQGKLEVKFDEPVNKDGSQ